MLKKNKLIKSIITFVLFGVTFSSMPLSSFAYYCTSYCYSSQICGNEGTCSLSMSCDVGCDGHHAEPCWIVESYPTCTTPGRVLVQHCTAVAAGTVCHKRDVWQVLPALGHAYSVWICDNASTHHRTCSRCGDTQRENHNYCPKYPIAYQENGDTHITTYRHDCYQCGYSETWTEIEEHSYTDWEREDGSDVATRKCEHCAHMQYEWIGIELDPLSNDTTEDWTNEAGTITGKSKFWNDCTDSTPVGIKSEKITSKNLDTDEIKDVKTSDIAKSGVDPADFVYTENREGRYEYTYTYKDSTDHEMDITLGKVLVDHSAPQLTVRVNVGGTDNLGQRYENGIEFTQSASTMAGDKGINFYETKWTKLYPTITASATDYFKDTNITGVGVHSVIIYDDLGHVVAAGANSASYSLQTAEEGTHVYTIVATDNLARDAYRFGDALFNERLVYDATGECASEKYKLTDWSAVYDINHVTVAQVKVHVDRTAPVILGLEDDPAYNDPNGNYYLKGDANVVYLTDNIINQYINDFPANSKRVDEYGNEFTANDSSDIATIRLLGFDKNENKTVLAVAARVTGNDAWTIVQPADFEYKGSGYDLSAVGRTYTKRDLLPLYENGNVSEGKTVTRLTSTAVTIKLNTDPRYEDNDGLVKRNPITDAILDALKSNYEYYAIQVTDIADNRASKKLVPQYAELRTIHTTIDPSTYKNEKVDEYKKNN